MTDTEQGSVTSTGDRIIAELNGGEVEGEWQTMQRLAEAILDEAESHKPDLQRIEGISGAWIRVSCDCCDYEEEFEYARDVRQCGATPAEHAAHPDFDCDPGDVTLEAFCPRHGPIPMAYDECDSCASTRAMMNR